MSEFKVIETQEQFDALIGDRLAKNREKVMAELSEKYADYEAIKSEKDAMAEEIATLKQSLTDTTNKLNESGTSIDELKKTVAKYESDSAKTRIAMSMGIPYEMADRLSGTTEEELIEDAKKMAMYFQVPKVAPMASTEPQKEEDGVLEAFRKLNPNLKL